MATGDRLVDVLDEVECRRLLATASLGRIAFTEGAIPTIQPAAFAVSGEDVLVPTGLGSNLAAAGRDAVLAFEVDDYELVGRTGWHVTVIGPSRLISDPGHVAELDALGVLSWAPTTTHGYVALRMAVVRGRRISAPGRHGCVARPPTGLVTAVEQRPGGLA